MSKETTSKRKTKRRVASFFGRLIMYIMILGLIAGIPFAYNFGHSVFYASSVDSPPGSNVQVNITDGMNFDELADILYDKEHFLNIDKLNDDSVKGYNSIKELRDALDV